MKTQMLSICFCIIAFSLSMTNQCLGKEKNGATLTVHVKNLKNTDGKLEITLFDSESSFLQKGIQQVVQIEDRSIVTIQFKGLVQGIYAISVVHDEDGNGEMNTGFLGIPIEDYGFSNNAKGRFGPPSFEQTKFQISGDQQIEININ